MRRHIGPAGALAALAVCAGCMSVEIETRADRQGGGTRDYTVILHPSLATTYESARRDGEVFSLPGDALLDKPGVSLVSRSEARDSGGFLAVVKSFRADRLADASTAGDSISYSVAREGLRLSYRYREHYLATRADTGGAGEERYRFRHSLRLPGRMLRSDADSLVDGAAVWSRPMSRVRAEGVVMTAESGELDRLALAVLAGAALAAALLVIIAVVPRRRP